MTWRGREIDGAAVSLRAAWGIFAALLAVQVWFYTQHDRDMGEVRENSRRILQMESRLAVVEAQVASRGSELIVVESRQRINEDRIANLLAGRAENRARINRLQAEIRRR